jgi:hypothetical protein
MVKEKGIMEKRRFNPPLKPFKHTELISEHTQNFCFKYNKRFN